MKTEKFTFLVAVAICIIVHGSAFSQIIINEDTLLHFGDSLGYLYQSGRWALQGLGFLRGLHNDAWIIGIFFTFYLAAAVSLIVHILNIKNKLHIIAAALIITAFPPVANQLMFIFMADAWPLSLLLAAFSIFCVQKWRFGFLFGSIALMLSLALYQTSIGFALGLALLVLIKQALDAESSLKSLLNSAAKMLSMGALGVLVYFVSVWISLQVGAGQLFDYQGLDEMGRFTISRLPSLTTLAYSDFFANFTVTNNLIPNQLYISSWQFVLNIIVLILTLSFLVLNAIQNKMHKNPAKIAIIAAAILLLPLALNIKILMAPDAYHHSLMTHPFVLIYLLPLIVPIKWNKKIMTTVIFLILALLGATFAQQSRAFHFSQRIHTEATFAFYNRLLLRIEQTDGFCSSKPIAFIGNSPFDTNLPDQSSLIVGISPVRPAVGVGQWYKMIDFLNNYLNTNLTPASTEQIQATISHPAFAAMPSYPAHGSIQMIEGILVVKLSYNFDPDAEIARPTLAPAR